MSKEELEIKEANELRAKLGLKPLKPWKTFIFVHVIFIHKGSLVTTPKYPL